MRARELFRPIRRPHAEVSTQPSSDAPLCDARPNSSPGIVDNNASFTTDRLGTLAIIGRFAKRTFPGILTIIREPYPLSTRNLARCACSASRRESRLRFFSQRTQCVEKPSITKLPRIVNAFKGIPKREHGRSGESHRKRLTPVGKEPGIFEPSGALPISAARRRKTKY